MDVERRRFTRESKSLRAKGSFIFALLTGTSGIVVFWVAANRNQLISRSSAFMLLWFLLLSIRSLGDKRRRRWEEEGIDPYEGV